MKLDIDWPRVAVHVVVVVAVVAFLTQPGSPGGAGVAVVNHGMAGLIAEAVT